MWHQPCQRCNYTTLVEIQKRAMKKLVTHVLKNTCERSESVRKWRIALYKSSHHHHHHHYHGKYHFDLFILFEDVPLVEFMYLVFTRMPGESYRWRLRSLLLCLNDVFRGALINSPECGFSSVRALLHLPLP